MNKPKVDIYMPQKIINFCANGCGDKNFIAPNNSCSLCNAGNDQCASNQHYALDTLNYLLADNSVED